MAIRPSALSGNHVDMHLIEYAGTIDCNTCHQGGGYTRSLTIDTEHASGAVDLFINNIISTNASGNIDFGTGNYSGTPVAQDGYGACSNVYCHSNAQTTPIYQNPTWGDTNTTSDCTFCHNNNVAAAAAMNSGAHTTHIDDSDNEVGRDLPCITCHEATVDNTDRTIIDFSKHVNKTKDIDINITGETDCNNIQCHSDGNFDGTLTYNNPTWNSDTLGCVDCHGDGGTQAYPSYANGGVGGDSNSHDIHVATNSIDCGECHDATSTVGTSIDGSDTTKHVNQTADVVLDTGAYVGGSESCSNTACHGTSSDPWGTTFAVGTDTCTKCHGTPSAAPAAEDEKAPPVDTAGQSGTVTDGVSDDPQVGAHQAHIGLTLGLTDVLTNATRYRPQLMLRTILMMAHLGQQRYLRLTLLIFRRLI
jgi:predicted CxxxxCH...CXXCH cytochrome family protein